MRSRLLAFSLSIFLLLGSSPAAFLPHAEKAGPSTPPTSESTPSSSINSERLYNTASTHSLYITMRDGVKIAVDVALPKGLPEGERIPALLNLTRYWRARGVQGPGPDKLFFISHGYAMVLVDVRGTGASFGTWRIPFSREEILDDREIIDWIVSQPWSNGKVGALGTSYEGGTAQLVAVSGHAAVKAVIPRFEEFDNYSDIAYPGGVFAEWILKTWNEANHQLDNNLGVKPVDGDSNLKMLRAAVKEHSGNVDLFQAAKAITYRDDRESGLSIDDFSIHTYQREIEQSKAAIYGWGSWLDAATADGVLRRFTTFTNPQRVMIGTWNHGGSQNADPYLSPLTPNSPQLAECLRFFDHYLKGIDAGAGSEREIIYYTMGEERWKSTKVWPPAGSAPQKWYLAEDHTLSPAPPQADSGADTYKINYEATTGAENRWHTEVGGGPVIYPDRAEEDRRLLSYTSAPLSDNIEITGAPMVTLYVTSTHTDGAFFVYLEDVDENGKVTYLTEGELRAIHRKISDDQPPYKLLKPYHTFMRKDGMPLVPGQVAELKFGLLSTSILIRKGHRIRVALAGADKDTFARIPSNGPPVISVARNKLYASSILLPVIPRGNPTVAPWDPWPAPGGNRPGQGKDLAVEAESASSGAVTPYPTVPQIIDGYIQALGGREAIEKLATRVTKGVRISPDGVSEWIETYSKEPDKRLTIRTGAGRWAWGSDGTVTWSQNPGEAAHVLEGPQSAAFGNSSSLHSAVHLHELYPQMKLRGKDRVGDREAYVVECTDTGGNAAKLFFDTRTRLLLRRDGKTRALQISVGKDGSRQSKIALVEVDNYFDDYREVDGVKVPFLMNSKSGRSFTTYRELEMRHNIPIDDAKFKMP